MLSILAGKFCKDTIFAKGDHRTYNRNGETFDKGELFSGVDYKTGLMAVEELKALFMGSETLEQHAVALDTDV